MNDFTTELQQNYPSLFYFRNDSGELLSPAYGIDCPEGWRPLVRRLCAFIDQRNKRGWIVKIAQIKEKFGTLRFYVDGSEPIIEGVIEFAEHLSSLTCEITGETGCLCVKDGWYKTLSLDKAKELGFTPVAP